MTAAIRLLTKFDPKIPVFLQCSMFGIFVHCSDDRRERSGAHTEEACIRESVDDGTQRSERSDYRAGGQYGGGGAPRSRNSAYVANQETIKSESEMTVAQGGNPVNEKPGDSADTESGVSAVPVDAMAAEGPSRHRRRSNTLSRCQNDSTSHRAFRNITTQVL